MESIVKLNNHTGDHIKTWHDLEACIKDENLMEGNWDVRKTIEFLRSYLVMQTPVYTYVYLASKPK